MNSSTPGPPVHHQLREFTQTHVHWVGDAIQPSQHHCYPSSFVTFCYTLQWFQSLWGLSFQFPGFLVSSPLQPPEIFSLTLTQQLIALVIPYTDLATANIPIPFPGSLSDYCLLSLSSLPFSDSKSDMSGSHPILEQVTFPSPTWTLGTRTHSEILLFVVNNC